MSKLANKYDLLGREEFLDAYESFNGADARATLDGDADTDWQDEVFRTAFRSAALPLALTIVSRSAIRTKMVL